MESGLWPTILCEGELASDGIAALAHFVAEQAVYKAQYAQSKQLFRFQTIRLTFTEDHFEAEFQTPVQPFEKGTRIPGHILRAGGYLGAFVALSRL